VTDSIRLVLFAVVLVVALGVGLVIGAAVGPIAVAGTDGGALVQVGEFL